MTTAAAQRAVARINQASCYYEILQVGVNATTEEILQAYKKLAKEVHPDRNRCPGATTAFQKLGTAKDVLSDPKRRFIYAAFREPPRRREPNDGQEEGGPRTSYKGFLVAAAVIVVFGALYGYQGKNYSLRQDSTFSLRAKTKNLGVEYYVDPQDLSRGFSQEFEEIIENEYISGLKTSCSEEMQRREEMFTEARIMNDRQLFKKAHYMKMSMCDILFDKNFFLKTL